MASSMLPTISEQPQREAAAASIAASPENGDRIAHAHAPPLENGDRLTRAEFERRYQAMPYLKKAELIEGVVHMPSPVRIKQHANPHFQFVGFLWLYQNFTPGVGGGDNATVRLDVDNEPQPDGLLYVEPECGGRVHIDDDDYISSAPDLVAEIAASTVSIDLGKKLHVYRRNQIQEYIVWRVQDRAIDWFSWKDGEYQRLEATPDGIVKSQVFPGLWLDLAAIVRGDFARAHAVLQQGLQSPEHAALVERLHKK
jgi:Uma2 family endonuclease